MTAKSSNRLPVAISEVAVRRIAASTLAERAFHAIAVQILTGVHAQGARLREADLIAALGMSRTPIREAIQRLELIGLVEALPSRYTVVTPVTAETTAATKEFAALYAGSIARLAAARLGDSARAEAVALTEEAIAGVTSPDQRLRTQVALFGFLLGHADNDLLASLLGDSWYLILRNLGAQPLSDDGQQASEDALRRLSAAIGAGECDDAERSARALFGMV